MRSISKNGVGPRSDFFHATTPSWFVSRILGTSTGLNCAEFLHLKQALGSVNILNLSRGRLSIDKGVSHGTCTGVRLRGCKHLLAEALIELSECLRLLLVLVSSDFAVKVA